MFNCIQKHTSKKIQKVSQYRNNILLEIGACQLPCFVNTGANNQPAWETCYKEFIIKDQDLNLGDMYVQDVHMYMCVVEVKYSLSLLGMGDNFKVYHMVAISLSVCKFTLTIISLFPVREFLTENYCGFERQFWQGKVKRGIETNALNIDFQEKEYS